MGMFPEFSGFRVFDIVFWVIFALVAVLIVVTIIRGIARWNKNNHSPRVDSEAKVVAKRMDIRHMNHGNAGSVNNMNSMTSTWYYVTFQFTSGDRIELEVPRDEYGLLAEGDTGTLTFQGKRYLGFERKV